MSATAGQAQDQHDLAERLGIKPGHVVQEIGYDDDCDEQLRELGRCWPLVPGSARRESETHSGGYGEGSGADQECGE